ncbi:MAG TPA: hypothetical protein PKV71_09165 [Calditrichia bacterium]|nr:hypothetical protein [Calditrichota bacterium]HQU72015.1 hypothetical protein [Calditrichia bacterium]HQV32033.1 hypothetical protein [Calditrichia bacterium]
MKRLTLLILIWTIVPLFADGIEGQFRTATVFGSGFWSSSEFDNAEEIQFDYPNLRLVNQLRLNGQYGRMGFYINGLHNAGFATDSTLSEAKIYQAYGQMDFRSGYVKLGRISSLNRWYWGSYDGGAVDYKFNKAMRFSAFGGFGIPYGDWYDADNGVGLAYLDWSYRKAQYGMKLKSMVREEKVGEESETLTRAGVDFWGKFNKLRFSGDYGYDFTNTRISDGGLNLSYQLSPKLHLAGNYRLMRSEPWDFPRLKFSYLTERFVLGARYDITQRYYLRARQIISMNSDFRNYISYLVVGTRNFYLGGNYMTSDYDVERWGFTLGGKFRPFARLLVEGALSPVKFERFGSPDHIQTLASFLKLHYQLWENVRLGTYWAFYNDLGSPEIIETAYTDSRVRGQIYLSINF